MHWCLGRFGRRRTEEICELNTAGGRLYRVDCSEYFRRLDGRTGLAEEIPERIGVSLYRLLLGIFFSVIIRRLLKVGPLTVIVARIILKVAKSISFLQRLQSLALYSVRFDLSLAG